MPAAVQERNCESRVAKYVLVLFLENGYRRPLIVGNREWRLRSADLVLKML